MQKNESNADNILSMKDFQHDIPGLANWNTEKSFKSKRLIKAAAFLI